MCGEAILPRPGRTRLWDGLLTSRSARSGGSERVRAGSVSGQVDQAWMFVFREPVGSLGEMVPAGFSPWSRGGWGFWNLLVAELSDVGLGVGFGGIRIPRLCCFAHRLYARSKKAGDPLLPCLVTEGLWLDRPLLSAVGGLTRIASPRCADVQVACEGEGRTSLSAKVPGEVLAATVSHRTAPMLGEDSVFGSLFEAKAALRPPSHLVLGRGGRTQVVVAKRNEYAWHSRMVSAAVSSTFLAARGAQFEVAFEIDGYAGCWSRRRE